MSQVSSSASTDFFSKNLSVAGFTENDSLLMCAKELMDNAVDAVRRVKTTRILVQKKPRVEFRVVHESDITTGNETVKLICRDTGEGISCDSVEQLGSMFASTKNGSSHTVTAGKFGIGLKLVHLYSQKSADGKLFMKMRLSDSDVWTISLKFDEVTGGSVIGSILKEQDPLWEWMTEISVQIGLASYDQTSGSRIFSYGCAYNFWNPNIAFDIYDGALHRHYPKSVEERDNPQRIRNYIPRVLEVEKAAAIKWNDVEITVEAAALAAKNDCDQRRIVLLRSANFMPMLPKDAMSCVLLQSVRHFLKAEGGMFGLSLRSISESPAEGYFEDTEDSKDSCVELHGSSTDIWIDTASQNKWSTIVLLINISGCKIEYGNLTKSYIHGASSLRNEIVTAIQSAMKRLKQSIPDQFQSIADYRTRQAIEMYAPSTARSLSQIVCRSDPEFRKKVMRLLDLPDGNSALPASRATTSGRNRVAASAPVKRQRGISESDILYDHLVELIRKKILSQKRTVPADCSLIDDDSSDDEDDPEKDL